MASVMEHSKESESVYVAQSENHIVMSEKVSLFFFYDNPLLLTHTCTLRYLMR